MMKDRLQTMFALQEELMQRYKENDDDFPEWPIDLRSKKQQKFVRDVLTNSAAEIFEAAVELRNHKQHRQTEILEFDREKFLIEIIDAQKFLFEACIMLNITAEEFMDAYVRKNNVCHERLNDRY